MQERRTFFHVVVLASVLVAAGCVEPVPPEGTRETTAASTTATTGMSTSAPPGPEVTLSGVIVRFPYGVAANVSAHNQGTRILYHYSSYCAVGYGSWQASLSGPPGENLSYENATSYLGCPSRNDAFGPGEFANWTSGADYRPCTYEGVCGNFWDGKLRNETTKKREPAPAGEYTWHFTFSYDTGGTTGVAATPGPGAKPTLRLDLVVPMP